MATSTDVQLVVQVVDKASAQLGAINKTLGEMGKTADEAHKQIAQGSQRSGLGLLSLNQGLELAKKGFAALKFAIEAPIQQFTSLFSLSSELVKKYDEQFLSEQKLANAARASGNASSDQVAALIKLDDALEKTTRFQAESIEEGQAMALTFGVTAEQMPKVTQAALALAQATGSDAATGFQKLAQAVETGTLRTFGRLGIEIPRTGNAVKDFATASDVALKTFGGSVERSMQGGAAGLITLDHAIEQIKKQIGQLISTSPQFAGFVSALGKAAGAVAEFIAANKELIGATIGDAFSASLQLAAKGAVLFASALELAGVAITKLLNGLDLLAQHGIGTSPFKSMEDSVEKARSKIQALLSLYDQAMMRGANRPFTAQGNAEAAIDFDLADKLKAQLPAAEAELKRLQQQLIDIKGGNGFSGLGESIRKVAQDLSALANAPRPDILTKEGFMRQVSTDAEAAAKSINDAAASSEKFGRVNFEGVTKQLEEFLGIAGKTKDQIGFLDEAIINMPSGAEASIESVTQYLKALEQQGYINEQQFLELSRTLIQGMDGAGPAIDEVDRKLKQLKRTSDDTFKNTRVGIPTDFEQTKGVGTGASGGATSSLDAAARAMSAAVVSAAGELATSSNNLDSGAIALSSAVESFDTASSSFSSSVNAFSSGSNDLVTAASALINSSMESGGFLKDAANGLIQAANGLLDAAFSLGRGSGVQRDVPKLASGGVLTGQTYAQVGERPEVVIPLDDRGMAFAERLLAGKGGKSGGDTIHVNINVDRMDLSDESMNDLARIVERRLADRVLESVRRG